MQKIFNYEQKDALHELIDIPLDPNIDKSDRCFFITYLNCIELLTLSRDYHLIPGGANTQQNGSASDS
jgi:hypothetical protein